MPILLVLFTFVVLFFVMGPFVTVAQGTVAVVTMFGKYRRILLPGLNMRIPVLETIARRISIQNQSVEMNFQAITLDQANVHFKAMLLYSVVDHEEETIKSVAFKFIDQQSLMTALVRTVEGCARSFVATKKQAEILLLRRDIVEAVKTQLDHSLASWGYHLIDLQMNDVSFDPEIIQSMAKVVASSNLRAAAENEGQALLITKTKQAEAEGKAIQIAAEAERAAAQLRGQGVALFREEVAKGMRAAAEEMKQSGMDASVMLFSMWTDALKHFAENGRGNTIFLDGSTESMERTLRQLLSVQQAQGFGTQPSNGPSVRQ
jgi:regulator of protease activity HflC (stomatin/prohibitin superfamily)